MSDENKIRETAYYIWLNNGCPEGVAIECWLEAECCCEKDDDATTYCSEEGCVCVKCGHNPCTCDPCTCGDECECCSGKKAEKAPAKKAAAKKTAAKAEAKPAAKKAPAKKAAAKK